MTEQDASLLRTIQVLVEPLSDEALRWLIDHLQQRLSDGSADA